MIAQGSGQVLLQGLTVVRFRDYSYSMIRMTAIARIRLTSVALKMQAAAPEGIV